MYIWYLIHSWQIAITVNGCHSVNSLFPMNVSSCGKKNLTMIDDDDDRIIHMAHFINLIKFLK